MTNGWNLEGRKSKVREEKKRFSNRKRGGTKRGGKPNLVRGREC